MREGKFGVGFNQLNSNYYLPAKYIVNGKV